MWLSETCGRGTLNLLGFSVPHSFPSFPQKTLMRTYGGLARFIVQMGSSVVDGLKRLEGKQILVTAFSLRNLEQLMTPVSREEVMVCLNDPEVKLQDIEKAIQRARHRMWVNFVWNVHPDIDPTKSVFFFIYSLLHPPFLNLSNVIFFLEARVSSF